MQINRKATSVLLLILIIITTILSAGCQSHTKAVNNQAKNVKVFRLAYTPMGINAEYPGKLKPAQEITIASKTSGYVDTVNYDVGMPVKMDDILINMDKRDAEAQYGQSKAALGNANANLVRTSDSSLKQQLTQAETAKSQAQLQYDDAKRNYDRVKQLFDAGAASKQDMDNAESKLRNAEVQLDSAATSLELLQSKGGQQSIDIAEAQVLQAQASVKTASLLLDNTQITSPISGMVSARYVDAGEIVSAGTPLMAVIDTSSLIVETGVPEKVVSCIEVGQIAQIEYDTGGSEGFSGIIEEISPNIDPKTQNYIVKIKVDNREDSFKPGMIVKVIFKTEWKDNVLAVPNQAIIIDGEKAYIMVARDGTARKVQIETGIADTTMTEISGEVKEGESVIVEGQSFVNDGDSITITK